jgi:hypothetical protein
VGILQETRIEEMKKKKPKVRQLFIVGPVGIIQETKSEEMEKKNPG